MYSVIHTSFCLLFNDVIMLLCGQLSDQYDTSCMLDSAYLDTLYCVSLFVHENFEGLSP